MAAGSGPPGPPAALSVSAADVDAGATLWVGFDPAQGLADDGCGVALSEEDVSARSRWSGQLSDVRMSTAGDTVAG